MTAGSFSPSLNIALLVHVIAARHWSQQRHFSALMKDLVILTS